MAKGGDRAQDVAHGSRPAPTCPCRVQVGVHGGCIVQVVRVGGGGGCFGQLDGGEGWGGGRWVSPAHELARWDYLRVSHCGSRRFTSCTAHPPVLRPLHPHYTAAPWPPRCTSQRTRSTQSHTAGAQPRQSRTAPGKRRGQPAGGGGSSSSCQAMNKGHGCCQASRSQVRLLVKLQRSREVIVKQS